MDQFDQFEINKRNETFVFDNNDNGLDINATNVIQEQPLNISWDGANAACNYTNDFVHETAPMTSFNYIDLTTQNYPTFSNETQYNYVREQVSTQNPSQSFMDTTLSLPDNFFNTTFNPHQMSTNDSEVFRFAIPGFQIIVIPTSSSFAYLNNFDLQNQFQQDQDFSLCTSSISHSQLNQDVSGVYETPSESSVDLRLTSNLRDD